jgi:hypothetical protein
MTSTAEERAKEIMTWLRRECSDAICAHLDCPSCGCMAFIAQAIRSAENDKLEEAERAILNEHSLTEPADLNIGLLRASRAVKALRLSSSKKD